MSRLITSRALIRKVAQRWHKQYFRDGKWHSGLSMDAPAIYSRLLALDLETATSDDVTAVIGNASWNDLRCSECERKVDAVCEVGEEPDYESATAYLCIDCLRRAMAAMEGHK